MSTTMRKVVITELGASVDVLKFVTVELPAPGRNESQVEIIYAGFSGGDNNMRNGWYPMQKAAPLTPGYCFVGRVRSNGPGASTHAPGTLVVACTVYDSDAEAINIPEKYLNAVPEGVSPQVACALTLDWNTAYGMVHRAAKVTKGQRVFVHGLSGAVGYALLKLCKLQGATVYGTASARNHDSLRELGAEPFVYTDKKWIEAMKEIGGVHAAFDPLGFESYDESFSILTNAEPSIMVGFGQNSAAFNGDNSRSHLPFLLKLFARNAVPFCKKSTTFYYITRDQKTFKPELEALFKMAQDGKIEVPIKTVWEFDDIKEAHRSWGKTPGIGSQLVRIGKE